MGYLNNKWSKKEIGLLLVLVKRGYSVKRCIGFFPNRSYASIANKLARLRKNMQLWGKNHARNKRKFLEDWLIEYKPKFVIEGCAGRGITTELYATIAKQVIACEYSRLSYIKAKRLLSKYGNVKLFNTSADMLLHSICASTDYIDYDWIDLDPFGTVSSLIPLAVDVLRDGYICCTITDLHSLRFGKANPISWRYLLPPNITNMKVITQLGFILGWIIFDCSRRIYPRGSSMVKKAKIVKPINIVFLGPVNNRLVRVLFKIEMAKTASEIKGYIFKELRLFNNDVNVPYLEVNQYLSNAISLLT